MSGHVKKPKVVKETTEVETVQEFDSVAVGIMKGEGKKRIVVKIPYNTKTLETGSVQIIEESEDNQLAQSVFKKEIMINGLFT